MNKDPGEIKYENRLVAFIDILGFKELVKASEHDSSKLRLIYDTLIFLKNREVAEEWNLQFIEIEEDAQKRGIDKFDIQAKTSCTCFSDSIVISTKVDHNDINESLSTLIANLSFIGAKLMTEGILFRGALTVGNMIHIDDGLSTNKDVMSESHQL